MKELKMTLCHFGQVENQEKSRMLKRENPENRIGAPDFRNRNGFKLLSLSIFWILNLGFSLQIKF